MALPNSGSISHSMIMGEFKKTGVFGLSANGASLIKKSPNTLIKESDFYGASDVPPYPNKSSAVGGWGENDYGAGQAAERYTASASSCSVTIAGSNAMSTEASYFWVITNPTIDNWTASGVLTYTYSCYLGGGGSYSYPSMHVWAGGKCEPRFITRVGTNPPTGYSKGSKQVNNSTSGALSLRGAQQVTFQIKALFSTNAAGSGQAQASGSSPRVTITG